VTNAGYPCACDRHTFYQVDGRYSVWAVYLTMPTLFALHAAGAHLAATTTAAASFLSPAACNKHATLAVLPAIAWRHGTHLNIYAFSYTNARAEEPAYSGATGVHARHYRWQHSAFL